MPSDPLENLLPSIYDELRALAKHALRRERANHTLTPTALVHEAYVRLAAQQPQAFRSSREFCAAVANTFRRVLVDHARAHRTQKRGGDAIRVTLGTASAAYQPLTTSLIDLDTALAQLEQICNRRARIVELRFFGGLTEAETAEELGLSTSTVQKSWRSACAWLRSQLPAA